MYTPRNSGGPSPIRHSIPEGPIKEFATIIESTQPEDWEVRTQALLVLVDEIPAGSAYGAQDAWFNSPPTLRHLALPLGQLLKDPRSTVVKRACEASSELFAKCQSDARYLLKDLMPTVMALHAQTVAVIRASVQAMILDALAVVPCKMVMPIWLDRLRHDKSRTVREACSLYLGTALNEWGEKEGYLSPEIWKQVSTALGKALRDPSPNVRQAAKKGLEVVHQHQPDIIERLMSDRDLTRDARVKKTLQRIMAGETVGDDVSVASKSVASRSSYLPGAGGGARGSPYGYTNPRTPSNRGGPAPRGIPQTIGVESPSPIYMRDTAASNQRTGTRRLVASGLGPPIRMRTTTPFSAAADTPSPAIRNSSSRPSGASTPTSLDLLPPDIQRSTSFDTVESDLPVIAKTAQELHDLAKLSKSRRSSLLQERFARSNSSVGGSAAATALLAATDRDSLDLDYLLGSTRDDTDRHDDAPDHDDDNHNEYNNGTPEHIKIAHELLEAHKKHVDQTMDTLKVEMDTLKEFELVLLEEPTEEDVLEYFESVGLCLDQRGKAVQILLKKMDRIATSSSNTSSNGR